MLARNSYDTLSNVFFVFPLRFHPSEIKKILSSFSFPTNNQKPMGFTEKKNDVFTSESFPLAPPALQLELPGAP